MGDFFKSAKFKILVALLAVVIVFMFVTAYLGGIASPVSQALGIVTAPFQKLSSSISGAAVGFFERYLSAERMYNENQLLKEELRTLREKLVEFDSYKQDNEHYREYLELKNNNPTFAFEPAQVIGRDPNDRFFAFTVDRGTANGVSAHDPVITPDGLVGWVSEVGLNYAKVTTLLDVSIDIGAVSSRTRDIGVVSGEVTLSREERCKMSFLPRESQIAPNDIVVTSGLGGVFPKGLIVGIVEQVETEKNGMSLYAIIDPAAEIQRVKEVFILTSFGGQGSDTAVEPPASPTPSGPGTSSSGDAAAGEESGESASSGISSGANASSGTSSGTSASSGTYSGADSSSGSSSSAAPPAPAPTSEPPPFVPTHTPTPRPSAQPKPTPEPEATPTPKPSATPKPKSSSSGVVGKKVTPTPARELE